MQLAFVPAGLDEGRERVDRRADGGRAHVPEELLRELVVADVAAPLDEVREDHVIHSAPREDRQSC